GFQGSLRGVSGLCAREGVLNYSSATKTLIYANASSKPASEVSYSFLLVRTCGGNSARIRLGLTSPNALCYAYMALARDQTSGCPHNLNGSKLSWKRCSTA